MQQQSIYVIDTNVIVDYTDIIPNGNDNSPEEATIDLSKAHIAIPTAVIRELSSFKKESSDRGKAARIALKRIRTLVENQGYNMIDFYNLEAPITVHNGPQKISILPIHKDFHQEVPFHPSEKDMDGQIILATLSIILQVKTKTLSTSINIDTLANNTQVILLTNDNGLAIRAAVRGIHTSRYGYKHPPQYSGRRDIEIPAKLFQKFINEREISLEDWEKSMPKESPLIANEFLIMRPKDEKYPPGYNPDDDFFTNIGRYEIREKRIVPLRYVGNFPTGINNPGQAIYAEALLHPDINVVICTGPAGTGKTYMATIYSYLACKNGDYIGITVVPCQIEDDGIGYLPGDLDEKLDPNIQPIKNALRNFLINEDSETRKQLQKIRQYGAVEAGKENSKENGSRNSTLQKRKSFKRQLEDKVNLIWDDWFGDPVPIAYARGRDFSYEIAFYDEFQDQNRSQADTLIKRLGKEGKIIITGDIEQIHAAYLDKDNNGLVYARHILMDNAQVAQITFTDEEVVRHRLVRAIAKKQKSPTAEETI